MPGAFHTFFRCIFPISQKLRDSESSRSFPKHTQPVRNQAGIETQTFPTIKCIDFAMTMASHTGISLTASLPHSPLSPHIHNSFPLLPILRPDLKASLNLHQTLPLDLEFYDCGCIRSLPLQMLALNNGTQCGS